MLVQMCLTMDGSALITCSEDGSICIWGIKDYTKDVNVDLRIDIRSAHYDDILVNVSQLERINEKITKSKLAVSKLESEYSYTTNQWKKAKEQEVELQKISISQHYDFVEKHNKVIHV